MTPQMTKASIPAVPEAKAEGVGAPENEIEITCQMVDAGCRELFDLPKYVDEAGESPPVRTLAERVYRAMESARRGLRSGR